MCDDIITVELDIEPSPWRNKYVEVSFSIKKLQPMVDEILTGCYGRDYTASYHYDKHINDVLKKHWNKDLGSMKPLLKALCKIIHQQKPSDKKLDWRNEYVAAARSITSMLAYMTPGFIEAKRYNEMYG